MSAEEDSSLAEKRVYGEQSGSTPVFVATGAGLAHVEVAGDRVGEFSLAYRGATTDVVVEGPSLGIATPEDALLETEAGFVETGFGPATAVCVSDDALVAAGCGRVAELVGRDVAAGDCAWTSLGLVDDVRAIDEEMVAAAGGVFRPDGTHVGLDDARDVAVGRELYAATADGLYRLGNGWRKECEAPTRAVATRGERAYAVTDDGDLLAKEAGAWDAVETPGDVLDVALGPAVYAISADGTVVVDASDGFRERALGLDDARRLDVP
jgi:hypothetical protein